MKAALFSAPSRRPAKLIPSTMPEDAVVNFGKQVPMNGRDSRPSSPAPT